MRSFLLVLITCISSSAFAQEYTPLVVEGAVWVIWYEQEYVDTYHAFEISGDTVIGEATYKKVMYHQLRDGARDPYIIESSMVGGAIREDVETKQVWGRIFFDYFLLSDECRESFYEGAEYLMHDFNYAVGDTILGCSFPLLDDDNVIDSIYHEEIFGVTRKVFANVVDFTPYPILIEGIGNLDGLFSEWRPFVSPGDDTSMLEEYCTGGTSSCNLVSSVWDGQERNIRLKIYPNPVDEVLIVENPGPTMMIYDLAGRQVKYLEDGTGRIAVSGLLDGVYIIRTDGLAGRFIKK